MSRPSAYVVDDEPLGLRRMTQLLRESGRVEVEGGSTDPRAALDHLRAHPVDVLFLDIQMPELDGLSLAEQLPKRTSVVFTTAYDAHALRAFEVSAIDYLLKPVDGEQLRRALDKVERLHREDAGSDVEGLLARLREELPRPAAHPDRLPSRLGNRVHLVEVARVTHFYAEQKLTYAAVGGASHPVDLTLTELEHTLDPRRFFRIHRATLVNLAHVRELLGGPEGMRVRLDGVRAELPVARDRVRALEERLGIRA